MLRSIAALIGALGVAASWCDERWYAAAWLGMILFFAAVAGGRARWGLASGLLFGVCFLSLALHWAPRMLANTLDCEEHPLKAWVVFCALVFWESIPFALLGWGAAWATRQRSTAQWPLWIVCCGWVAVESCWPRVFPWSLAHTQTGFVPVLQIAELGGAALVSFVMVAVSLDAGGRLARRDFTLRMATAGPALLLVATLSFGWWRLAAFEQGAFEQSGGGEKSLRVGVVQIDPSYGDSTVKMCAASDRLLPVDLLAWPESTLGSYSTAVHGLSGTRRNKALVHAPYVDTQCVKGINAWLLAGGKSFEPGAGDEGPYFQTAYLIDPQGAFQGRYYKRDLMPIGEYAPLEAFFPSLHDWVQLGEYTSRGVSDEPVQIASGAKVGVLLCYEDIVSELSRRTVAAGAEVLVCLINGSAFEEPAALEQHRRLATLRAIENRRTLVRCAGTGVSCSILPTGRVDQRLPVDADGSFVVEARMSTSTTVFGRGGHLFPYLAGGAAVALGMLCRPRTRPLRRALGGNAASVAAC